MSQINKKIKDKIIEQTIIDINKELSEKSLKIIKSISIIEDLIQNINMLNRRIYEEIDYYDPALLNSNSKFNDKTQVIELLNDLLKSTKKEIGAELLSEDKIHLNNIKQYYMQLVKTKDDELNYLNKIMLEYCPNLNHVATTIIGAKLIKKAGSLKDLAFMTSSLIQVLGAEKALFRHLSNNSKMPKYGYLIDHPISISSSDKAKACRLLASKITIAVRTDYFSKGKIVSDELINEIKTKLK